MRRRPSRLARRREHDEDRRSLDHLAPGMLNIVLILFQMSIGPRWISAPLGVIKELERTGMRPLRQCFDSCLLAYLGILAVLLTMVLSCLSGIGGEHPFFHPLNGCLPSMDALIFFALLCHDGPPWKGRTPRLPLCLCSQHVLGHLNRGGQVSIRASESLQRNWFSSAGSLGPHSSFCLSVFQSKPPGHSYKRDSLLRYFRLGRYGSQPNSPIT